MRSALMFWMFKIQANKQSISILRTNEYFGQYGKISKLYIRDRSPLSSSAVHTLSDDPASHGIYIVYVRREDAARAISSLDGIPAPSGAPGTTLKASYGTTRYCDSFLRGMKCDSPGCHYLHEWGGDSDCFSKDDYETAYAPLLNMERSRLTSSLTRPAEYEARQKQAQAAPPPLTIKSHWPKPAAEGPECKLQKSGKKPETDK